MESKSDKVRRLVGEGNYKEALRIAKGFRIGTSKEDSDAMRRGYECMVTSPRFYQSIVMNPAEIAQKGRDTVQRLYGV